MAKHVCSFEPNRVCPTVLVKAPSSISTFPLPSSHLIPKTCSAHRHCRIVELESRATMTGKKEKPAAVAVATPAAPATASSSSSSALLLPGASPALFTSEVANMDRQELNRLDMRAIPHWARLIVEKERRRRKNQGQPPSLPQSTGPAASASTATAAALPTAVAPTIPQETTATMIAAANPRFQLKIPEKMSSEATTALKEQLPRMDRENLNKINMQTTPSWARHLINEERCRRKKGDGTVELVTSSLAISEKVLKDELATIPAVTSAMTLEATSTFTLDLLPASKSDKALAELKIWLPKMDRKELNLIDMRATPDWARPLINKERCRRKKLDPQTESEQRSTQKSTASAARATTTAATSSSLNRFPFVAFNPIPRQPVTVAQPSRSQKRTRSATRTLERPAALPETEDGGYLNDELVLAAANKAATSMWNCNIIYDSSLYSEPLDYDVEHRTRDMFGEFHCTSCRVRGKPRFWHSAEIFTRFWFKYIPASGRHGSGSKDTLRYQSLIYFQKCQRCEQFMRAELDRESYVKTAIKAFELWTGRRDREYRADSDTESDESTKPHDEKRCRGCLDGLHHVDGIHHAGPHGYSYKDSYRWKF